MSLSFKKQISFALTIIAMVMCCNNILATDYYISSSGSDSNNGTSSALPWRTLNKVSTTSYSPGDRILFRRGDTFIGQLNLQSSGNAQNPIVISAYGNGNKPIINGSTAPGGDYEAAILIENQQYIEIRNLDIRNNRLVSRPGNDDKVGHGIYVHNTGNQTMFHFVFDNLTLQDIYAIDNTVGFDQIESGGIFLETERNLVVGQEKQIRDVTVNNCFFTNIEKLGVWTRHRGNQQRRSDDPIHRNWDFVITNNHFFRTGGSGVVLSRTYNALVENNLFEFTGDDSNPRMTARGSGAWFFQTSHTIAQYNISKGARGSNDSYGMHIDSRNEYIILQYNYSEDAEGGFAEVLGGNRFATYRYNISVNEGFRQQRGNTFWIDDFAPSNNPRADEVYFYNNSIYVNETTTGADLNTGINIIGEDAYIYNNLIATGAKGSIGQKELNIDISPGSALNISNNVYSGTVAGGFTSLDNNPTFGSAGYANAGGFSPEDYRLQTNSAALNGSLNFTEPPFPHAGQGIFAGITAKATEDFFGNPVDLANSPHIGAFNGTPVTTSNLSIDADLEGENATKFGTASVNVCNAASNGALAFQISSGGDANRIEFQNIDIPVSSFYTVAISYFSISDRTFSYKVNGGVTVVENVAASGPFCFQGGSPGEMTFDLFLNQGLNDFAFFNAMAIDKIRITQQVPVRLEAEDAVLSGTASIANCNIASESQIVNQARAGINNAILFENINTSAAGEYNIRLGYFASVPITASIEINGGAPQTINLPATGNWCFQGGNPDVIDTSINLATGNNTIKIYDINVLDYIDVFGINSPLMAPLIYEAEDATLSGAANTVNCNSASNNEIVTGISQGSGANAVTFNVNAAETGNHEIIISHISSINQTIAYQLNGGTVENTSVNATGPFCYQGGSPGDFTLTLNLNAGNNTLKFYDMGPLDKISVAPSTISPLVANTNEIFVENNFEKDLSFKIFPNPTNDLLNIDFDSQEVKSLTLKIYTLDGKLIFEEDVTSNTGQGIYQLRTKEEGINNGIFLLVILDDFGNRQVKRVMVIP